MKSFKEYSEQTGSFYNSLLAAIDEPQYIGESLLINRGSDIDSILNKLNIYEYRQHYGSFIHESLADVSFTLNEQFASRDLFINIVDTYAQTLCEAFAEQYEINEAFSWQDIKDGVKNTFDKVKEFGDEKKKQFQDGLEELKSKLKDVYEFVKDVSKNAIKSAKEMIDRFLGMFEKLKTGLNDLLVKFGEDVKEFTKEIEAKLEEAIKNKAKRPKDNIYEQLGLALLNGEQLNEGLFNKSKGNKDKDKDADKSGSSDEYDDAQDGAKHNKDGKQKTGWKAIVCGILKQVAISVIVTIFIPALGGLVWGAPVAFVLATIAKAAMSGYAFIQLLRNIYNSREKFKKASALGKAGYIILWLVMLGLTAWGAKGALGDIAKLQSACDAGAFAQLVPDSAVQNVMKLFSKIKEAFTGEGIPNYVNMEKLINGQLTTTTTQTVEVKPQELNKPADGVLSDFNIKDFKNSVKAWTDYLLKKGIDLAKVPDNASCTIVLDGSQHGEQARKLIEYLTNQGWSGEIADGFNKTLNAVNSNAGAVFTLSDVPAHMLRGAQEAGLSLGVNGFHSILSAVVPGGTVTQTVTQVLHAITGTFVPIVAMPTIVQEAKLGDFRVRMGSGRTGGYDLYTIKGSDAIKTMKFAEARDKFKNLNSPAIDAMVKTVTTRFENLKTAAEKTDTKNLKRKERKKVEQIQKKISKTENVVNDCECLVFFSEEIIQNNHVGETEVKDSLSISEIVMLNEDNNNAKPDTIKETPVLLFNPLTMTCCDLVPQRKAKTEKGKEKGPRKRPVPMKGLYSSYEFLPLNGGASTADIDNFIIKIILNSIRASLNLSIDVPCKEVKKNKWEENTDSTFKGAREDFGNFTNKEITGIMNDPKSVKQYFNGLHKKGSSTVDKENTESQKERKAKAKKEWVNAIENEQSVKDLIEKSKTLKQLVDKDGKADVEKLDDLFEKILRSENNYGETQTKKGFWKRFIELFKKNKDNGPQYDPKELQSLSLLLKKLHNKNLRKRKKLLESGQQNESYAGEYFDICDQIFISEATMYLFEDEKFADFMLGNITEDDIYEDVFEPNQFMIED